MGALVNQVKKISAFCATELENRYYLNFLFPRIQRQLVKEHPYPQNKQYEKKIKEYYGSYGFKIDPMWHMFYTDNNGIEDVKYIPENLYFGKIEPFYNRKEFAKAIDDKNYYDLRLDTSNVKIPYIYIRNIDGIFYDHDFNIVDEEECKNILRKVVPFVIKPSIDGKGGADVSFIDEVPLDKEFEEMFLKYNANFVIQEVVHQDGILHKLNPSSVNTVRFMTFIVEGSVVMLSSVLRLGGGVVVAG